MTSPTVRALRRAREASARKAAEAEVRRLWDKVKSEPGVDIRQLRIDFRHRNPVHFIEYRAYEPQWQPRVFDLTVEEALDRLRCYAGEG